MLNLSWILTHTIEFILFILSIAISILLAIYIESRPSVEGKESLEKYIDYSTGLEVIKIRYRVKLGRMPYFKKVLFREVQLDTFSFFDASFSVYIEGTEYPIQLKEKDWYSKNIKDQKCIFLRKSEYIGLADSFNVILQASKERSRGKIEDRVTREVISSVDGTTVTVRITLMNNWDLIVKNYEVPFSIPTLKGLRVLRARKIDAERIDIPIRPEDFGIRLEVPLPRINVVKNKKFSSQKEFTFTAFVDLPPGTIEIEFQYEKE